MQSPCQSRIAFCWPFARWYVALAVRGQQVKLIERPPDPHGSPRPCAMRATCRCARAFTSSWRSRKAQKAATSLRIRERVDSSQQTATEQQLLRPGVQFAEGCRGWLRPKQDLQGKKALAVYIEPAGPLEPDTRYTVDVSTAPGAHAAPPIVAGTWSFTTEAAAAIHASTFPLDLRAEPVPWHGRFFSGICNVIFCTQAANYGPTYDLMAEARKQHPRAWSYQRDFWMTGSDHRPPAFLPVNLPNIVRERETRRIAAIEPRDERARAPRRRLLRPRAVRNPQRPAGRRGLSPRRRGPDRRRRSRRAHQGHRGRRARAGTVTVAPVAEPARRLEDRLRGATSRPEDPDAPGLFAAGRLLPAQVQSARHGLLLLGPARQGVGPRSSPLRPPPVAQPCRCPRRPFARRPELDHRQGLRPVARGRPHDRRPHHRPLRRRRARLHLERLQRARPGPALLAGRLERAANVLRLHDRRDPAGLRGPRTTTPRRSSSAASSWAGSSARTSGSRSSSPTARPGATPGAPAPERRRRRPPARRQAVAPASRRCAARTAARALRATSSRSTPTTRPS